MVSASWSTIVANSCLQFVSSSDYSLMKDNISKLYTRIVTQTMFIGTLYRWGYIAPPNIQANPVPFSSLEQARESLDGLYSLVHLFLHSKRFEDCEAGPIGPEKHITLLQK